MGDPVEYLVGIKVLIYVINKKWKNGEKEVEEVAMYMVLRKGIVKR